MVGLLEAYHEEKNMNPLFDTVQSIYDVHKAKLNTLKENRAKAEEQNWSDAEINSVDSQIALLASILSDLYRNVLTK